MTKGLTLAEFLPPVIMLAMLVPREINAYLLKIGIADIAFLSFFLLWLAHIFVTGRFTLRRHFLNIIVLCVLSYIFLIAAISLLTKGVANWHFWLRDLYSFITLAAVFVIFNHVTLSKKMLSKILFLLFSLYALLGLWSILMAEIPWIRSWHLEQWEFAKLTAGDIGYFDPGGGGGPHFEGDKLRIGYFVGGMGHIGSISLLTIPLLVSYLHVRERIISKWLMCIIIFVGFVSLIYLMSRTVFVAVLIGVIASSILLRNKMKIAFVIIIFAGILLSFGLLDPIISRFSPATLLQAQVVRIGIYAAALDSLYLSPLTGIGMGNFIVFPYGLRTEASDAVDSLYLTLWLKLGVIGAILFLGLFVYLLYGGWRYLKSNYMYRQSLEYRFVAGIFGFLCSFLFTGLFGYPLAGLSFTIIFWIMLGLYSKVIFSKQPCFIHQNQLDECKHNAIN